MAVYKKYIWSFYNDEKKNKKKILAVLFLFAAATVFFLITEKISQSHKKEHSGTSNVQSMNYESYIEKYGTGETLQYSYFTSNSGVTEENISYITLEVYEKNDTDKRDNVKYYIKDKMIIKKIFDVFNQTEYKVSNLDFRGEDTYSSSCRIQFIGIGKNSLEWFGYYTPSDDTYIFAADFLSNTNLSIIDALWLDKYLYYGFFVDNKIMQVLNEIMKNNIKQITMEEIREILAAEEIPAIQDFYGYIHTLADKHISFSDALDDSYYEYRLDIENYDGYLLIKNTDWTTDYSMGQDILSIYLYDAEGNLLETFYEK